MKPDCRLCKHFPKLNTGSGLTTTKRPTLSFQIYCIMIQNIYTRICTTEKALDLHLTRYKIVLIEVEDLLQVVKVEGRPSRPQQQPASLLFQRLLPWLRYFVFEEKTWGSIKKTTSLRWDCSHTQPWPRCGQLGVWTLAWNNIRLGYGVV